jgi:hypothetical protein
VSNCDAFVAYEDFLDQEPENLLALPDLQAISPRAESFAKLSQRFHQAQILGLMAAASASESSSECTACSWRRSSGIRWRNCSNVSKPSWYAVTNRSMFF